MIMELLDVDHPLDCPICEANGDCRLQDFGYEYGVIGKELRRPKIVRPAERLSPAIDLDRDRCVMCGRCVRALRRADRRGGAGLRPARHRDGDGRAVRQVADGHALRRVRHSAWRFARWARSAAARRCTRSTTGSSARRAPPANCAVGCTMQVGVHNNLLAEVRSQDSVGVNDGIICVKGRFGQDFVNNGPPDPAADPPGRRHLPRAPWEEALDLVAERLNANKAAVGVGRRLQADQRRTLPPAKGRPRRAGH